MTPWQDLLNEQCGVFSTEQALMHGWTEHALRAQLRARRWQRPVRGVYVAHTGPLSNEQRVWVAVLYGGEGCLASHDTALWLADRKRPFPAVVRVTVPPSRKVRPQPGILVHRSRCLDADVQPGGHPPRVRVERAALDCAAAARTPESAVGVLAEVVQQRLTTAERLLGRLRVWRTFPRRGLLIDAMIMCGRGAQTLIEIRHEQARRSHSLPPMRRQVRRGKAVVDAEDEWVIVECDGRPGHMTVGSWWDDMMRDNLHVFRGKPVLRFPGFLLLTSPHVVAHIEAAVLRRRGWTGQMRCPAGCPGYPEADAA